MTEETTTEQLAEIEGQGESTPVTEYTPPEGWRVLQVGEVLRNGDMWVWPTDDQLRQTVHVGAVVGANQRYIRRIEPQPQTEPDKTQELETKTQELEGKTQELPEYTPPEGWRVVRFGELLLPGDVWVNHEGESRPTKRVGERVNDERYIRPIDPQPQPEPEPDTELQAQVAFLKGREVTLGTRLQQEKEVTTRLRGDLELVQNLLGESRQRVTQLEELVASLRTINEGAEKAVSGAGVVNDSLRLQLAAVKAELAQVSKDRYALQAELDAAQQVPADSPELRQLRADLAEVTLERDQYLDSYQRIFGDLETIRETTKAETVEAIAEWLEPVRAVDNEHLANETLQHLPQIMRHLTGLALED